MYMYLVLRLLLRESAQLADQGWQFNGDGFPNNIQIDVEVAMNRRFRIGRKRLVGFLRYRHVDVGDKGPLR